jgi:hypothetical protein
MPAARTSAAPAAHTDPTATWEEQRLGCEPQLWDSLMRFVETHDEVVQQLGMTAFQAVLALVDDEDERHDEAIHHVVSGLPITERSATELLIEEAAAAYFQFRMYN